MESFEELKRDITDWIDERIDEAVKTAVAEANKDLVAYLDTRFGDVEKGINDTGIMVSAVSRDVAGVVDSVAERIESEISKFNPFRLP